jgi:hypothetical protein
MKSIGNTHKLKLVTIAVFITAAMIAVTPIVTSTDAFAAQRESRASALAEASGDTPETTGIFGPWSCASKTLTDSPDGNNLGWDPNGSADTFTIDEPCYIKSDSTVLVNIKDGGPNFEVCNVDYASDFGFFEVFCNAPPAEGSELHYIVFVDFKDVVGMEAPTPEEEVPQDIAKRQQTSNSTQQ